MEWGHKKWYRQIFKHGDTRRGIVTYIMGTGRHRKEVGIGSMYGDTGKDTLYVPFGQDTPDPTIPKIIYTSTTHNLSNMEKKSKR